ncbi:MAG: tetratricopeptide repeat protein [Pseudomonadota bacterium]
MIELFALLAATYACGPLVKYESGGDYLAPGDRENLAAVETFHFTQPVESLSHGINGTLGADLSYTLDRFPNHARALAAMARLALREKTAQPRDAKYTLECYFERALRMRQDDAAIHTVYGGYLLATNHAERAFDQFARAVEIDPASASAHYNLGLIYLQRRDFEQARTHARRAYELGLPMPGLKNKLIEARQWEP